MPTSAPTSSGTRWPRAGFLGVNVPEEYGGGGGGITELAAVQEELAAAGCPLLVIVVSPAICATIIARFGTDAQKQRWLPRFATGELKMAFAITEPDAGSNSHNLALTATKDGDLYRLNGSKYYISGVDECEAVLVVTRSGVDPDTGRGRLSLFVVDVDTPGLDKQVLPVEITAPEKQYTLFFDNVQVEADRLIGDRGRRTAPGLRRAQPRAHPVGRDRQRHRALRARTRRPSTRRAARSGAPRSRATRASPIRWPRPRSRSSWPG